MQVTELSFVNGPIPAKYAAYKYTLLYYLDQLPEGQKASAKKALARRLNIQVRMLENYIYARITDRRYNLSDKRVKAIAKYFNVETRDITPPTGQESRIAGIGAAAGGA